MAAAAMAQASVIVAVSEPVATWVNSFPDTASKCHVIPNGVDLDRFRPRFERINRPRSGLTVGFVGTLKPWHDLDTVVEALAVLVQEEPGLRFLVVGDGPGRPALEARLSDAGLAASTHFTGAVSADAVPGWLSQCDIALAPYSADEESYFSPLKLLEYLAAGIPTIAADVPAASSLVRHDEHVLLYPPGDAHSLALNIATIARHPSLGLRLARTGRRLVEQSHGWDHQLGRILDLLPQPVTTP
jgi:glycosyltransferase involved in cell wall biosynthesis